MVKLFHRQAYTIRLYADIEKEARRSLTCNNAGGNSDISEMYSMDYMIRHYGAKDITYEMEINYWVDYKMIDYICTIRKTRLGVSVTRAMYHPITSHFTAEMAQHLLHKKLFGLITASNSVIKRQRFYYALLHIWCESEEIADYMAAAYQLFIKENDSYNNVFILLTVCENYQLYGNILLE